jgi:hypothetical protein
MASLYVRFIHDQPANQLCSEDIGFSGDVNRLCDAELFFQVPKCRLREHSYRT